MQIFNTPEKDRLVRYIQKDILRGCKIQELKDFILITKKEIQKRKSRHLELLINPS